MLKLNTFNRELVVFSALYCLCQAGAGFASEYKVDNSHSNVGFKIRHMVGKVSGNFKDYDITIDFDPKKPTESKINAVVKAASINTDNQKRDEHLQSDDFFAVQKYPTLTFVSKKITEAGHGKYKMMGDMTLRGVTKPVTFDVEYFGDAKDPWGMHRIGFSAETKINRKDDFKMVWNKSLDKGGLVLGEDVDININIEAVEKTDEKKSEKK